MTRLILLNKPFDTLCQFTDDAGRATLANFVSVPRVYPAGRLDRDSEGLVLLTDDGALQRRIADPACKLPKRYLVQVDGDVGEAALARLRRGPALRDGPTTTLEAHRGSPPPSLWARDPPVRYRRDIPTSWIEIVIAAGRNRQVRRMTAAVGHPTLRLVRLAIGPWTLGALLPGESREGDPHDLPAPPGRAGAARRPATRTRGASVPRPGTAPRPAGTRGRR